jgi:predicted MPP superfamily phosphohydrolase
VAAPLEALTIPHPLLPDALVGLRILHFSDLHLRRGVDGSDADAPRDQGTWWRQMLEAVASVEVDLALFTGDWCDAIGQEAFAARGLVQMARACRATLGCYGIFGNHDNPVMRKLAISQSGDSGIIWLGGRALQPCSDVRLLGMDYPEDPLATLMACGLDRAALLKPFTLTLAHRPTLLVHGAELGLPMVFAGHTHGGQVRLPLSDLKRRLENMPRFGPLLRKNLDRWFGGMIAPHTSSDMPGGLASGASALGGTLCCVSRGMGDSMAELIRFGCPRHVPLYTLVRGKWPEGDGLVRVVEF